MEYTYWLPDNEGKKQEYKTTTNSVIIVGANGSGKSRLGLWLKHQNRERTHRIGAQRDLRFNHIIAPKDYAEVTKAVYNSTSKNIFDMITYSDVTKLFSDYDDVLSALTAKDQKEKELYFNKCKEAELAGEEKPSVPNLTVDTLLSIWNRIFPRPSLLFEETKILCKLQS